MSGPGRVLLMRHARGARAGVPRLGRPGDAEAVELWVGLAGVGAVTIFSIGWWAMFRPRLGGQD